jgi:putative transcriptional regulator
MADRRVRTIAELARRSGLARSTLTPLWYGRVKRIDTDTLEALCKALNCQPGDLLVYVPDEEDKGKEAQR